MEEKLIELETKFSYQEDLLLDLNAIVTRQQLQLDELISEISEIKGQLQDSLERGSGGAQEGQIEMPPHY
ncbi:MAG: SlyX family protein [Gammaproteobacteria bacterium]|nr:SlyX family protein [Gammaproteobacteria bacterium]